MDSQQVCKNCGNTFTGKYCNNCGQKIFSDKDKSFRHFIGDAFHFFTHLDNKFLKTLFTMFRRPGLVSLDYTNGIRAKYFNPFSVFFIGVILYLLFSTLKGLNMELVHYKGTFRGIAVPVIESKMRSSGYTFEELSRLYNNRSSTVAKPLLLIILPLTGLVFNLIGFKKKKFFYDHLVLATEAAVFYLYLTFFIMPLVLMIPALISQMLDLKTDRIFADRVTFPLYLSAFIIWLTIAIRKFYGFNWGRSIASSLFFCFFHTIIVYIVYRLILFYLVMLFI